MQSNKNISLTLVIVIFLLWMAPGLVGRDLWKADEPYSFGLIQHVATTGDWVVPTLAGEPFLEKPPVFFLTAAGFAKLFSSWLPLHDAARLACAFYMVLTLLFLGLAARELLSDEAVAITLIVMIGSTGLQMTSHKLITDNAMITGVAMALYGTALSRRRSLLGGFWIGTGAGIGFMAKGLLAPGLIGVTALALPVLFVEWRKKEYLHSLLIALVAALPWSFIWPTALYLRSERSFIEWFWYQNLGRFLGFAEVDPEFRFGYYFKHIVWFTLPALPVVLWLIWHRRRALMNYSDISIPLISFALMFTVFTLSSGKRTIYMLPMLLPLALLTAAGVEQFPERAKNIMNKTGIRLFGALALALWLGWIVNLTGKPASLASRLAKAQPDYVPAFVGSHFAIASVYTLLWIAGLSYAKRLKNTYLINWTSGIVLVWALLMTLWLPWLDAGSGYRPLFTSLKKELPPDCRYVMTLGLGESERALMYYYTGVFPKDHTGRGVWDCDLLLIQNGEERVAPPPGPDWELVGEWWRPSKPQDNKPKEMFTLLRRTGGTRECSGALEDRFSGARMR